MLSLCFLDFSMGEGAFVSFPIVAYDKGTIQSSSNQDIRNNLKPEPLIKVSEYQFALIQSARILTICLIWS